MKKSDAMLLIAIMSGLAILGVLSGESKKNVLTSFDFQSLEHRKIDSFKMGNMKIHNTRHSRYTSFSLDVKFQSGSSILFLKEKNKGLLNNALDLMNKNPEERKQYYAVFARINWNTFGI